MTRRTHTGPVAVAAALLLAACAEGYPERSDVVTLHYDMGQAEAIRAMNQVVKGKQQKSPARFAMLEDCVLEVHARRPLDGRESRTLPLRGVRAVATRATDSDSYHVTLHPRGSGDPGHTVVHGVPWTTATQMKWLLEYLPSTC